MCIINNTHRFVFVHIPKNAGTSVSQALSPLTTWRDLELGGTELGQRIGPAFQARFGIGKHATLAEITALVAPDGAMPYHTFAVVRHPLPRLASTWRFLHRWHDWMALPPWVGYAKRFRALTTLDAFVRSDLFDLPGPDRLFRRQTFWIERSPGGPIGVDRVLRIERLADELPGHLRSIGVPSELVARVTLGRRNIDPDPPTDLELSSDALARVLERYRDDLTRLGYDPQVIEGT